MNKIELIRTVTGVRAELTLLEAASLVRTLNRVKRIVDDQVSDNYEPMCDALQSGHGRDDAERVFVVARHVERVLETRRAEEEEGDAESDAIDA